MINQHSSFQNWKVSQQLVGFIKFQSVLMENQLGQNYSISVKRAVHGHESRIKSPTVSLYNEVIMTFFNIQNQA